MWFAQTVRASGGATSSGFSCSGSDGSVDILSSANSTNFWCESSRHNLLDWYFSGGIIPDDSVLFQRQIFIRDDSLAVQSGINGRGESIQGPRLNENICHISFRHNLLHEFVFHHALIPTESDSFGMNEFTVTFPTGAFLSSTLIVPTWELICPVGITRPCLAGFYSISVSDDRHKCSLCPVNTCSPLGSSSITNCTSNKGFYSMEGPVAIPCPFGTYQSAQGASNCLLCAAGKYSSLFAVTSILDCQMCAANSNSPAGSAFWSNCTCDDGYFKRSNAECHLCLEGSWCKDDTQTLCPVHQNADAGSSSVSNCSCNEGFELSVNSEGVGFCEGCRVNSFKGLQGNGACMVCPEGSQTISRNSTSKGDCHCVPGFHGPPGGPCLECLHGSYCPGGSSTLSCPLNADSISQSKSRQNCTCLAGYYGQDRCTLCPEGYSCPGGLDSFHCAENETTHGPGQPYCICAQGFEGEPANGSTCSLCSFGEFCQGGEASACPQHSSAPRGSDDASDCLCKPGYYSLYEAPDDNICQSCRAGFFCLGGPLEQACPSNSSSAAGSVAVSACSCDEGFFGSLGDSSHLLLPFHLYPLGTNESLQCYICEAGSWCSGGVQVQCPSESKKRCSDASTISHHISRVVTAWWFVVFR